ncbi:MAG: DUF262 domain-containing protein [Cyanobacteria bacterium P01_A01_bin.114]
MKAEERTISQILTEQICYEIPPYQRPYSWEKENVQQLLDDLLEAYEAQDKEYFIGSLITIERDKDRLYDVVDGQQRLTTLNVILARFRDHIANGNIEKDLQQRLLPIDPYDDKLPEPRLSLRRKDQNFFLKHILEAEPIPEDKLRNLEPPQRHLIENASIVDAFCQNIDPQKLIQLTRFILKSVYVVFVITFSFQSAYRLFNVLNARGMPLSNADLIKNSLFGQLDGQIGESKKLEESWLELEDTIGIDRLDTFFSHYRTAITATKARGALHEEMEVLIKKSDNGPFVLLEAFIKSAEQYVRIAENDFSDSATLRSLNALERVRYDEWIPPLLTFLSHKVEGFSEPEFVELIEKITMQNWVRRLGRAARLTIYYQLIRAIRGQKSANEIREIFYKNAQNSNFLQFLGGDIYGQPFTNAVLLRLEEAAQDESVTKIYSGEITIEHVLPQALKDPYWIERFEPGQHQHWVHKLGNLALLSGRKNYRAQYFSFDKKKAIYLNKMQKKRVSFDLTKDICEQDEWTVCTIEKRHTDLLQLAQEIWFI